jgi:hypothetical protein
MTRVLPLALLRRVWPLVPLLGCGTAASAPRDLRVVSVPDAREVFLNESLAFGFSEALDGTSVTSTSARIRAANGSSARGRWEVDDKLLRFVPAPALAPDLQDAGLQPDTRYTVTLVGYPHVDGLRGVDGGCLERARVWSFSTAPRGTGALVDLGRRPFACEPVRIALDRSTQRPEVPFGAPVRLVCAEPLDPSTVDGADFWIDLRDPGPGDETPFAEVHARLVANFAWGSRPEGEPCAVLELTPMRPLPSGLFVLRARRDVRLADYGGNPAWPPQPQPSFAIGELAVVPRAAGSRPELLLSFLSRKEGFSSTEVPWADGSAFWEEGSGRVRVRYPSAAGTGALGEVELATAEARRDVHAWRLALPAGRTCELAPGPGMRVLRAQGRLEVAGELVRESAGAEVDALDDRGKDRALSDWLADALEADRDWTVLIAGGDLVISGTVRCKTPLVLIAGGRVRIDGDVRCKPEHLYLLGEGGGVDLDPSRLKASLDEPLGGNPLARPLTYALVTSTLPRLVASDYLWRSAEADGRAGAGAWNVRYLRPTELLAPAGLVRHPALLGAPGPVRILIELEVEVGEVWDPPFVDFVHLTWDED